ncbi:sensor histidine kinase [Clostridium sp. YIM B02505]|uniref:histidine kinase n=1 Tax=Clostridium yunnanense TaxID=2800325 RepID=A0ABS1ES40_9CLOT|nr:sensor histidine kinase [Clostridium yunnanense]MBK1812220.1 sensor histidine kinase [Clostridium yunnanense]
MSLKDYLKCNAGTISLNIVALIVLSIFLLSIGNEFATIVIIASSWISVLLVYFFTAYKKRKDYFELVEKYVSKIDKKYLISEVLEIPPFLEAKPYYYLLKRSSKAMREEINKEKLIIKDYKEYIEQWVHEVKTPIALIKLIEENNRTTKSSAILMQLEEIDRYVEQALFYARTEDVDKDYLVKEISLQHCVNSVVTRNKQGFILNGINIDIDNLDRTVYCDSKWLEFILNQIIVNAIKYRKDENPKVKVYLSVIKNGIKLIVEDNGIGIPQDETDRVFHKGFTGNVGRLSNKSTGIGLYLCKKLCDKLGLLIDIESEINTYTKVIITFPIGSFCKL